jgi:hypothetical protein
MTDTNVAWLRGLAEKGGKGVVNNIDARSLGRIAEEIERLRACNETLRRIVNEYRERTREVLRTAAQAEMRCARCGSSGDTYVLCSGCGAPAQTPDRSSTDSVKTPAGGRGCWPAGVTHR